MTSSKPELSIGGIHVQPGERQVIDVPVAPMYTHDDLSITVQVVRGQRPGPTLFISAAIHGDEINGVEIIRRLLQHRSLRNIRGTLLAIPIVNVHGSSTIPGICQTVATLYADRCHVCTCGQFPEQRYAQRGLSVNPWRTRGRIDSGRDRLADTGYG